MKYLKFVILLVFSINAYSQNTFNLIIEDTINHVTCGIVEIDTGYIMVTGSRNEHLIRTFAARYINSEGNCIWKKTYTDSVYELWEGYNNIKKNNQFSYIAGTRINTNTEEQSIYLQVFDSVYNQSNIFLFYQGFNWKQALNQIYSDSSYYIVGQDYLASEDKFRLLLLKSNYLGDSIWCNTYGNISEGGVDLFINYNNEIVVGGITGSFSSPVNNSKWYIIKTDTAGNLIWEKAFGHNTMSNGSVRGLIETPDSCILACGTYPAAGYGAGGDEILPDGCLRKIDMNGDLVWEKRYRNYSCYPDGDGITLNASISSITQLDNNDFVLIGSSYWYYSRHRGFMIRTDSEGNVKWHRYYYAVADNSRWQYFSSFKPTPDKGFIIAGYGNDYSNIGYDPPQQAWLVKTDSLGMDGLCNTEPDELNIDIEIPEIPESICSDDTIQVYVHISGKSAPYTLEFSTGQVIDSIYYPPTFVPIEIGLTDINLQWNNQTYFEETITEATLSNHEWGQCIVKPVEFYTPATLGTHEIQVTVTDAYGESTSITKEVYVTQCSTYNGIEQNSGIIIYPNPVKELLFVEYDFTPSYMEGYELLYKALGIEATDECNKGKITIYSVNGMILQSIALEKVKGLQTVSLKDYASGIYVINVEDCYGNSNSIKITKE